MTPEHAELAVKLFEAANSTFGMVDKPVADFIHEVVDIAIKLLRPELIEVVAPKVEVDLSGLQRHENMEA